LAEQKLRARVLIPLGKICLQRDLSLRLDNLLGQNVPDPCVRVVPTPNAENCFKDFEVICRTPTQIKVRCYSTHRKFNTIIGWVRWVARGRPSFTHNLPSQAANKVWAICIPENCLLHPRLVTYFIKRFGGLPPLSPPWYCSISLSKA
jgi:hypothetical protein